MGMTLITTILPVGEVASVENTDYQRARYVLFTFILRYINKPTRHRTIGMMPTEGRNGDSVTSKAWSGGLGS